MITAGVSLLLMVLAFAFASVSIWKANKAACENRNIALIVLRDVLVDQQARDFTRRMTDVERQALTNYYEIEFARIKRARC